jgi:hypothetical protein
MFLFTSVVTRAPRSRRTSNSLLQAVTHKRMDLPTELTAPTHRAPQRKGNHDSLLAIATPTNNYTESLSNTRASYSIEKAVGTPQEPLQEHRSTAPYYEPLERHRSLCKNIETLLRAVEASQEPLQCTTAFQRSKQPQEPQTMHDAINSNSIDPEPTSRRPASFASSPLPRASRRSTMTATGRIIDTR